MKVVVQRIRPEIFILILLIICLIITTGELQREMSNAVSLNSKGDVIIHQTSQEINESKESGQEVLEYNPNTCKLIAVYNTSYRQIFTLSFTNDITLGDAIKDHIMIDPYLYGKRGSKDITIDDDVYTISFLWDSVREERYLIICASTKKLSVNTSLSIMIRYLSLILALTLFTTMAYWNSKDIARQFDRIRKHTKHIM